MRKVYDRIIDMRGNLITVAAEGVSLGEVARIHKANGTYTYASVLRFNEGLVTLQVFQNTSGISTGDRVTFLSRQIQASYTSSLLGRRLNGLGDPIDEGPEIVGDLVDIGKPSFNPTSRVVPRELVRTNIPMIDANANARIAARFTDSAGANPDAVSLTGPIRLSSVPRIPSE